jgi:hypothetical protein
MALLEALEKNEEEMEEERTSISSSLAVTASDSRRC